jgi:hypothetical protein
MHITFAGALVGDGWHCGVLQSTSAAAVHLEQRERRS